MKKRRFKIMWIFILLFIVLTFGIIYLLIPFSPIKKEYYKIVKNNISSIKTTSELFTESDIAKLPDPVQRFFRYSGYIGNKKMSYMRAYLKDVDFVLGDKKIKIDYEQFNFTSKPERYALISSSLYGIPFEGIDSYSNGKGNIKGMLAKSITIFNQSGETVDKSSLITWTAEVLLVPNAALQDFVKWEYIDETKARITVTWKDITVSGIFTFLENGELTEFHTNDRVAVDMNGKETKAEWSAKFKEYHLNNGIMQPKILQSVWHYSEGDCVYFNENNSNIIIKFDSSEEK